MREPGSRGRVGKEGKNNGAGDGWGKDSAGKYWLFAVRSLFL